MFDRSPQGSGINYLYAARHGGEAFAEYQREQEELNESTLLGRLSVYARVRAMQLGIQRMIRPSDASRTSLLRAANYVPGFVNDIKNNSYISGPNRATAMYLFLGGDFMADHPVMSSLLYGGLGRIGNLREAFATDKVVRNLDIAASSIKSSNLDRMAVHTAGSARRAVRTIFRGDRDAVFKTYIEPSGIFQKETIKNLKNMDLETAARKLQTIAAKAPKRAMSFISGSMIASAAAASIVLPAVARQAGKVIDMSERLRMAPNLDFGGGAPYAPAAAMSERERALEAIANANLNARSFMGTEASMYHGR